MERKVFVLSDQLIKQMADLLCMGMATRTHVGDHFRMVRVEESTMPGMEHKLVLTPEYVEVYNKQVQELMEEVEKQARELEAEESKEQA
jgi:hypothetical protein